MQLRHLFCLHYKLYAVSVNTTLQICSVLSSFIDAAFRKYSICMHCRKFEELYFTPRTQERKISKYLLEDSYLKT